MMKNPEFRADFERSESRSPQRPRPELTGFVFRGDKPMRKLFLVPALLLVFEATPALSLSDSPYLAPARLMP